MFADMSVQSEAGTLWVVPDLDGRVLGRAGFYCYGDQAPEFAVLLAEASWGAGLATEAARACLDHGFNSFRWSEVVAVIRPANARVRRVLEKLGFSTRSESEIRGKAVVWVGVKADEWALRGQIS
jgi:RimJ/RimL family protein N-acetyltransferase